MKLSPRLRTVAALAGTGESVIDVGTDHGYLPVFFVRNGLFRRVAASDINRGPLESARASARRDGVEDRIGFFLSDGLTAVPERFDTVVIAGMGGETMVDIISNCPWISSARLILQPQSKVPELEKCLDGLGFSCKRAVLAEDAGKLYLALEARAGEGGFDPARALLEGRDRLLKGCAERELARIRRALDGMEKGGADPEERERMRGRIPRLLEIIKEASTWQN